MSFTFVVETAAFLAGLLFGSFLNVCIVRLPYHESIVKPRSHCPSCLFPIRWYDNIPLLSWTILRARCRKCFQPISWRYPAVELAVGLWFCLTAHFALGSTMPGAVLAPTGANLILDALSFAILGFLLIGLLVMDWQTLLLPDAFTLTGTLVGFLLTCVQAVFLPAGVGDLHSNARMRLSSPNSVSETGNVVLTGTEAMVLGRLLAIVLAFCLLLLVRYAYKVIRRREGMGLGDAKLLAMIAAFLGFWPAILALFLGVLSCAAYAVILLARGKATAASRLPLGTFLAIGALLAAIIAQPMLAWYMGLLR
jgi:leader peptidase (prepilin peptidase)/N-methyltransferase